MEKVHSIRLAPLQGFTDAIYRNSYHQVFGGITSYYIPYISFGPGKKLRNSQLRDVLPENNSGVPVVPQILFGNKDEMVLLAQMIADRGYEKINLNMGCPYPMATQKGRGAGMLGEPEKIRECLETLFARFTFSVSVKLRSGLTDELPIREVIKILNDFGLEEVIFHPRFAKQMYKGAANTALFAEMATISKNKLVHNGDIHSLPDFEKATSLLPQQTEWMLGRGVLMDIFLPQKLNGAAIEEPEMRQKRDDFYNAVFSGYAGQIADQGHLLQKMQQFWSYFCFHFEQHQKVFKRIKKSKNIADYQQNVRLIFDRP